MQPLLRIILRVAVVAIVVAVACVTSGVFLDKYRQMCSLDNRCHSLSGRVEAKQLEIHLIKANQGRLLADPEFVARIAHQQRRVFPNELVFVFDDKM